MKNTHIGYLYRDANNYKMYNEAVLEGEFTKEDIELITSVLDGELFIPEQVGLHLTRPDDNITEDDHCWAEFDPETGIELTDEEPQWDDGLTWRDLIENFKKVQKEGWKPEEYAPEITDDTDELDDGRWVYGPDFDLDGYIYSLADWSDEKESCMEFMDEMEYTWQYTKVNCVPVFTNPNADNLTFDSWEDLIKWVKTQINKKLNEKSKDIEVTDEHVDFVFKNCVEKGVVGAIDVCLTNIQNV